MTATGNGNILTVLNKAHLSLYDLELTGGRVGIVTDDPQVTLNLERVRVTHNNLGIAAEAATLNIADSTISDNLFEGVLMGNGSLTIARSTIADNSGQGIFSVDNKLTIAQSMISGNQGGGLFIFSGDFDVTNNVIVGNGGLTSDCGGVDLSATNGTRRFDFNTVTDNLASTSTRSGVQCGFMSPVTFSNNIIYGNRHGKNEEQVNEHSNCTWTYSDIGPKAVSGTGNINAAPSFVNPLQHDYHLKPDSPGKDLADPAATLDRDFDGNARPQGGRRDIGADEIAP